MLELKNITKIYKLNKSKDVVAIDDISIKFRETEFVSILGQSGGGKTTLLNLIGGLDRYTSGDLIINGKSTKKYKEKDWNIYRNYTVGFVFQNYNLIMHQSVLSNVELALTLSHVSAKERRKRAIKALEEVGLKDQIHKKPNQLSGGQMQRVAIARALVNDPDIILADEPTGALDTKTSKSIMEILKRISKNKLIIMVTHNPDLANEYSSRIISLVDGKITNDTNPVLDEEEKNKEKIKTKKCNLGFFSALKLSFNNLLTKKGRTVLTSFAGSIGIVGIALILSLSNGMQEYINKIQTETLSSYPLTISATQVGLASSIMESIADKNKELKTKEVDNTKISSCNYISDVMASLSNEKIYNNLEELKKYLQSGSSNIDEYVSAIDYSYDLQMQLYKQDENGYTQILPITMFDDLEMGNMFTQMFESPWQKEYVNEELNNKMYDVVEGKMPENYDEIAIVVDQYNQISDYALYTLGIEDQEEFKQLFQDLIDKKEIESKNKTYNIEDLMNLKYKVLLNTDYYEKDGNNWINIKTNKDRLNKKLDEALELKVVGILTPSPDFTQGTSTSGYILYNDSLEKYVINKIQDEQIVNEHKQDKEINILTGTKFTTEEFSIEDLTNEQLMALSSMDMNEQYEYINNLKELSNSTYESVLLELGAIDLESPSTISIYPKDFDSKEKITQIIDEYNEKMKNEGKEDNIISYSDMVGQMMSSITTIINMISYILMAFVSISLVVSSIMIGIITYISVLERTKEIGILRALGASKKDIKRVFTAETLIVGLIAGLFGIGITLLINIPVNKIIFNLTNVQNISKLPFIGGIVLVLISVILTIIAGQLPARYASKKDPVEALRTE